MNGSPIARTRFTPHPARTATTSPVPRGEMYLPSAIPHTREIRIGIAGKGDAVRIKHEIGRKTSVAMLQGEPSSCRSAWPVPSDCNTPGQCLQLVN